MEAMHISSIVSLYTCINIASRNQIIKRERVTDLISRFNPATLVCLSHARTCFSFDICCGLFMFSDLMRDVIVGFVDDGGIVQHLVEKYVVTFGQMIDEKLYWQFDFVSKLIFVSL